MIVSAERPSRPLPAHPVHHAPRLQRVNGFHQATPISGASWYRFLSLILRTHFQQPCALPTLPALLEHRVFERSDPPQRSSASARGRGPARPVQTRAAKYRDAVRSARPHDAILDNPLLPPQEPKSSAASVTVGAAHCGFAPAWQATARRAAVSCPIDAITLRTISSICF